MPDNFVDTNVLLYLTSDRPGRAERVEEVIGQDCVISVQVLNEVANVTRRRMQFSWTDTHELLTVIRGLLPVIPVTLTMHESGLALAERYRYSVYDSMLLAAALESDCSTFWSEDLQHDQIIDGRLRIIDPFRTPT
jgi:predicted nucleic acid-binding protein